MRNTILSAGLLLCLAPAVVAGAADDSAVVDAAKQRDMTTLRSLVGKKGDVNATLPDGTTALHWAAHWDDVDAAGLLLDAGANPSAATKLGVTPLFLATQSGSTAMVSRLLRAGAKADAAFLSNGETPLMVAARTGNLDTVKLLLEAGAVVDAKETLKGTTALLWAAEEGHTAVVSLLLERGANPAAASKITVTAGRGGGAGPAAAAPAAPPADANGRPPISANARGGVSSLMVATRERARDTMQVLLDRGAPINQQSGDGTTALIIAMQNGDAETGRMLIERGADVNIANAKGWTPLFLAVKARTREIGTVPNPIIDPAALMDIIELMVEKGADVNAQTKANSEAYGATTWLEDAGATPLLRAAFCSDLEVIKYLLQHGANPHLMTTDHTTSLMALTGVGYGDGFTKDLGTSDDQLEALKLLVEAGVPINAANDAEVTALHGAAHKNLPRAIEYLVEHGADMTAVSQFTAGTFIRAGSRGQTVLDWATGVMVNMQSSSYKTEAVDMVTKLMKERGVVIERLTTTKGGLNQKDAAAQP